MAPGQGARTQPARGTGFPAHAEVVVILVLVAWLVAWLVSFWSALSRPDFKPVTRLTWVLVLIFVPCVGLLFYWLLAPRPRSGPEQAPAPPTTCFRCGGRLPEEAAVCPHCSTPTVRV